MTGTFRGFFALPLDAEAARAVMGSVARLAREAEHRKLRVRWVREEQLHVTLKFLGEVPIALAEQLGGLCARAAAGVEPIERILGPPDVFGSPRRARVLHLPVPDPDRAIGRLAERLEAGASELGIEREVRPFHAHVTLGRFKTKTDARALLEAVHIARISMTLDRLVLFSSTLGPSGSQYRVLTATALGADRE